MLAKELISEIVPSLKTSDTGQKALTWMEVFRVSHLPIVNNREFLGLISDTDIYDLNMAEEAIGNHKLSLFSPYVYEDQHIYEVIELISRLKLTVVPVLDRENNYLGLITQNELITYFSKMTAVHQPGAIIVLELHQNDYSLSQIAQIFESNDARILSLYVRPHEDSTRMEIVIKINRTELQGVLQTLDRYNYEVRASYMEEDDMSSLLESRYEAFMKYLNM